jgi:hypothetical protein
MVSVMKIKMKRVLAIGADYASDFNHNPSLNLLLTFRHLPGKR